MGFSGKYSKWTCCGYASGYGFVFCSFFNVIFYILVFFFFQAEDGIRDLVRSRGLGDVYKRQSSRCSSTSVLLSRNVIAQCSRPSDFGRATAQSLGSRFSFQVLAGIPAPGFPLQSLTRNSSLFCDHEVPKPRSPPTVRDLHSDDIGPEARRRQSG